MRISELREQLRQKQLERGDLKVMIVRLHVHQKSTLPSAAMGGGGAGYSREWYGTVDRLQISEKYPDQLEIIPVK